MVIVTAVAVVALIMSCVTITMFYTNNSNEIERLDDYEKRLDDYEKELRDIKPKILVQTLEFSEIKPVDVFQISNFPSESGTKARVQSEFAIDGYEDTIIHTDKHTNPWWCADMGDIYHVKVVVITNRKEAWYERSRNLRVGVTNTKPVVGQNLTLDAYTLCDKKPGLMGVVGIVSCPDEVSGQYLVVQFKTDDFMNIAEVKLYGFKNKP